MTSATQLPKNFRMIYASADTGKENIANRLLSLADKEAAKLLELICMDEDFAVEEQFVNQVGADGLPF